MSEVASRIFANLNPPQREAVETLEGPLLILAGAGSGKTRVVTRRIANLILHGAKPWEILAITFTNKAAGEMRRRVEDLVGQSGAWLSTFHSFCARILRREAEVLGLTRDFTIYDEEDATGILKEIVKKLGLSEDKRYSPRNVRQMISNIKNEGRRYEEMDESYFDQRVLRQVFKEYEDELKKNNALDFDDLLRQSVILFREHNAVRTRYQERFRYILVDEYQDTNRCQYELVKLLGSSHHNVCATGDPDQSIYGWRGADVRNILSFEKDFSEAKVVKLEQNYRSTQHILSAAAAVIDHNLERKKKTLWTENAKGDKIAYHSASDEEDEAIHLALAIDKHVRAGKRYRDFAVFYRTNSQSRAIEEKLNQSAIPNQIVGGTAFYERREIKDALAYLRLIVNPKDDVSFRRIVNVPKRSLGDSAQEIIEQEANRRGCALLETLDGPEVDRYLDLFKPKPRQGLIQLARLMDALRRMPPYPVAPIVTALLERSGLRAALLEAGEEERVDNLSELVNAATIFDEESKNVTFPDGPPPEPGAFDGLEEAVARQASLSGFLEVTALLTPTDKFDPEADRVTLMSLHMAKGLEFPIVFLTGLEEGLLPMVRGGGESSWSNRFGGEREEDTAAIEEERRLMYVGITRAMERLYISHARFRMRFGKSDITSPSRFLSEIPDDLLSTGAATSAPEFPKHKPRKDTEDADSFEAFEREVGEVFGDEQRTPVRGPTRRHDPALQSLVDKMLDTSDSQEGPPVYEIGDKVRHADFGDGIIESIRGIGDHAKGRIHFRGVGPKELMLSHPKLKKV
jgi:DNA helicase-2/ATP-dependent DNA helicase PcrA